MFRAKTASLIRIVMLALIGIFLASNVQAGQDYQNMTLDEYYVIGKGDVLDIIIWKEPELSRQAKVRLDGRISMPLVDDVMAAGKTPMELKQEITDHLGQFIEGPEVTVIVQNQISKSYYILGEVNSQGEYPMEKDVTLLQALARANGFTDWANKRNLFILRQTEDGEKRINLNYREIIRDEAMEQNLLLMPGDTLVVPY